MRVLLDTCVVSECMKPGGSQRVRSQVEAVRSDDVFLSAVTIGEIARGVALLDTGRKKEAIASYLLGLEQDYERRILGIDAETARIWGEATAAAGKRGRVIPALDGLIAATAIRHGLHVMTRNVSDFGATGAMIINPWATGGAS